MEVISTKPKSKHIPKPIEIANIPAIMPKIRFLSQLPSIKPISSIPFRVIDWTNREEVELHNSISEQTKNYLQNQDNSSLDLINQSFNKLFSITQ